MPLLIAEVERVGSVRARKIHKSNLTRRTKNEFRGRQTHLFANTNTFGTETMVRASGIRTINFFTEASLEATCTGAFARNAMAVTVTIGYFACECVHMKCVGNKNNKNE